jgi:hypothetical protein
MRRSWLTLVLVALTVAACGVRPSGVIPGAAAPAGPANGAALYLVSNGQLIRVLRPLASELSPVDTIRLLAGGPDASERELGYTSEVPPGILVRDQLGAPSDVFAITLSVNVNALSALAVDQIVCTARDSYSTRGPITLRGQGSERGPQSCPMPG